MNKKLLIIILPLLVISNIYPEQKRWKYEYYKTINHTNYKENNMFHQPLNMKTIDYPLLNAAVFFVTNEVRLMHGVQVIDYHSALEVSAFNHSKEMAIRNFFSHNNDFDKSRYSPKYRGYYAGISDPMIAENIVKDYVREGLSYHYHAVKLIEDWILSPLHRKNLLSKYIVQGGCGVYCKGRRMWATQNFQWDTKIKILKKYARDKLPDDIFLISNVDYKKEKIIPVDDPKEVKRLLSRRKRYRRPRGIPRGFVYVKAGDFLMGATKKKFSYSKELPQHRVIFRNSFIMSKYEVTFKQYDKYCKDVRIKKPSDDGYGRNKIPVIRISWLDSIKYCNWLSKKEGLKPAYVIQNKKVTWNKKANGYRLPTEAEWEYAARGGVRSKNYRYPGSNNPNRVAWYRKNSKGKLHPVGRKKPNELGLYDMMGNVIEYCWDKFSEVYYSYSPKIDPTGPESRFGIPIDKRVLRGGGYQNSKGLIQIYNRFSLSEDYKSTSGFRVVRTVFR